MRKILFMLLLANIILLGQINDTLKYDAVNLISKIETQGTLQFQREHEGFLYLFSTEVNLKEFENNLSKYEIQFGGGCGRMGSLSGLGNPEIFAIHDNKLYIFASQQCKSTFLGNSDKLIERDDPLPRLSFDQSEKGKYLLDKLIQFVGGEENLCSLSNYKIIYEKDVEYKGENVHQTETQIYQYPYSFLELYTWDNYSWGNKVNKNEGVIITNGSERKMYESQLKEFYRNKSHDLFYLLKARDEAGFLAFAGINAELDSNKNALLYIHFNGSLNKIFLDLKNEKVVSISYRGRGPNSFYGNLEIYFSDFKFVHGLSFPQTKTVKFNNELVPELTNSAQKIIINSNLSDEI